MVDVEVASGQNQQKASQPASQDKSPAKTPSLDDAQSVQMPKAYSRDALLADLLNRDLGENQKPKDEFVKLLAQDLESVPTAALLVAKNNGGSIRMISMHRSETHDPK